MKAVRVEEALYEVLIVAHAGVNRVILCPLLGMPLSHLFRLGKDYAGLNIIEAHSAARRVRALNLSMIFIPLQTL